MYKYAYFNLIIQLYVYCFFSIYITCLVIITVLNIFINNNKKKKKILLLLYFQIDMEYRPGLCFLLI